ncbi:tautomerase family protein [Aeromicrobium chenweiae]|nr:2-hydroxymuconate tautomerase family protein [Aeromicrobium chenweiae]TGN34241.1 4-oxalocrotonate tautomerase [Aeromicrobium chenweiae]
MPIIKVELLAGRSYEQKRSLAAALTDVAVDSLGVARSSVQVHLQEMSAENVAIGGTLVAETAPRQ